MAEAKVSENGFSKAEYKMMMKGLKALEHSLGRSKTKEGDSEIGEIIDRQLAECRNLQSKITTRDLF